MKVIQNFPIYYSCFKIAQAEDLENKNRLYNVTQIINTLQLNAKSSIEKSGDALSPDTAEKKKGILVKIGVRHVSLTD